MVDADEDGLTPLPYVAKRTDIRYIGLEYFDEFANLKEWGTGLGPPPGFSSCDLV